MPAHRKPFFIRPLLTVTRAEILAYLAESQLAFRTDSSNAKSLYLRNRVRHELLPVLKQLRPAVVSVLRRQADILREDDDCLEAWTSDEVSRLVREAAGGQWELERDTLLALPVAIQRRIVRQLLRRVSGLSKGPSFRSILTVLERVIHGQADTVVVIGSVRVARRSTLVQFRHIQDGRRSDRDHQDRTTAMPVPAERPSQVGWPLTGQIVSFSEETAAMTGRSPTSSVAVLDADRFTMNLQLRAWRSGDVFQPLGMHGQRKKLREFFIDRKVPRDLRRRVPLLVAPEGILWVAGYQLDERFRVTAETRRRLIVEVTGPTSPVANAD
jgi:tRNA(Ile)-lysidine synthase